VPIFLFLFSRAALSDSKHVCALIGLRQKQKEERERTLEKGSDENPIAKDNKVGAGSLEAILRTLAAADFAVVKGKLTSAVELAAVATPFM
jgi:hypothetical protein